MKCILKREIVSKPDAIIKVTRLTATKEWREAMAAAMRLGKSTSEDRDK